MRLVKHAVKQMLSIDVIITKEEFFKKVIMRSTACLKIIAKNSSKLLLFAPGCFVEKCFICPKLCSLGLFLLCLLSDFCLLDFLKLKRGLYYIYNCT